MVRITSPSADNRIINILLPLIQVDNLITAPSPVQAQAFSYEQAPNSSDRHESKLLTIHNKSPDNQPNAAYCGRVTVIVQMTINPRAQRVLSQVVDVYYRTCEPVGSTRLSRTRVLPFSPATIRNILGDLDDQGLLVQPHTSAGRVPTDLGYRTYVNEITTRFTPIGGWDTQSFDRRFEDIGDITDVLKSLAELIHDRTRLLSFYAPARHVVWRLRHLVLEPIGVNHILALAITQRGHAIKQILAVPEHEYAESFLKSIENYVNSHYTDSSLVDICRSLTQTQDVGEQRQDLILKHASRIMRALEAEIQKRDEIHFVGFKKILDAPEFQNIDAMRRIYSLIDDESRFQTVASRALANNDDRIRIFIGQEITDPIYHDLSICITRVGSANKHLGFIGVLGPRRMPYLASYQLLSYTKFKFSKEFEVS